MDMLRSQSLYDALATRILVLDGAMGTMLQARQPTSSRLRRSRDSWLGPSDRRRSR
jgi:methionine synthase I (cobalamin-dependent)